METHTSAGHYRYDSQNCTRLKTIELIIERKPWTPTARHFNDNTDVPGRIGDNNKAMREKAKGKWDPKARAWYIQFEKIRGTELEKFIIS